MVFKMQVIIHQLHWIQQDRNGSFKRVGFFIFVDFDSNILNFEAALK